MDYITVKEASEKWGTGIRIVTQYCTGARIDGAVKKGNLWLIPEGAAKPEDRRRRKKKAIQDEKEYEQRRHENPWPFQSLYENKELFVEIIKHFPYPIHICAPDGTLLLANEEYLKFAKISNPERLYKKHNILLNPDLERWGVKDFVLRAFQGEVIHAYDVKVPHQEIIELLGDNKELVSGTMFQNMTAFPVRNENNELLYIITVFTMSRYYPDKEEIVKGKEYIDNHWKDKFDIDNLAGIVHMSKYYYTRLFKRHTGMTPYDYYQNIKFRKLKEKLCNNNLSIAQVFDECGMDYNGNLAKKFKKKLGMTPFQYRTMMSQE